MLAALCVIMKIVEQMTGRDGPCEAAVNAAVNAAPDAAATPARYGLSNKKNINRNNSTLKNEKDKLLFRNIAHDKNNNSKNNELTGYRNNLNKRVNNVNNVWRTQHRMLEWHRRKRHRVEHKLEEKEREKDRRRKGLPPGGRTRMTEEIGKGTGMLSPGDLISNNNGETTASYAASYVSNTSSQNDADFIQDNSEYQWFLDYGYREGMHHQVSVLSSLSESYARGLLSSGVDGKSCGLYDDLARNLDANLAEVDMENFCAEDIHSLLNTLPTMCDMQKSNNQGEMFASMSALTSSLMGKFDFDASMSPHSSSQGEDSAGSIDTMSLCKSELLFSPVKESAVPGTINFSVDSLDSDIMLTCQANKDNYTIAFEGSTTMGSEDSEEFHDHGDSETTSTDSNNWSRNSRMLNPALAAVLGADQRMLNSSLTSTSTGKSVRAGCGRSNCKQVLTASHNNMARSDSTFTTWSKLKKPVAEIPLEQQQLSRHPSGNNNTTQGAEEEVQTDNTETAVKSRSLPNLARQQQQRHQNQQRRKQQIRTSLALSTSSSIETSCVKLYDVRCNGSPLTSSGASSCSGGKPPGGINLVRLFMKQRSGSGTDHSSSVSDGWDSDSCVRSATGPMRRSNNDWQSNGGSQSCRGKQVFRSCQGVDTPRNDNSVDECQCLPEESMTKVNDKLSLRSIDSLNCCHPRKNNGSWVRGEEMTDCSTCTFEDSLYRLEDGAQRTHEQITEEETEGPSDRSESVEQVSESISKISMARDSTMENVHSCDDSSNYSSHHGHVHGLNKTEGDLFHCRRYNVNNNNSLETDDISADSQRPSRQGSLGNCCCCGCENKDCRKNSGTQCQLPLINRSMQTSCMLDVLSKATLQELRMPPNKEVPGKPVNAKQAEVKEKEDVKTEKGTKPVYVYYPNYALPDLGFLKEKKPNLDLTKVYLRPQKFSATTNAGNADLVSKIPACLRQPKKGWKQHNQFSCSDVENLRKKGFKHVQDWNSLTFLLPKEYRVMLADVPEVLKHVDVKNLCEQDLHPLFCVTPSKSRHSHPGCDCTNLSSASSTNTQPSSGYRGSSTLLTDSSTQSPNYNPLFVYRYDSVSSEASLMSTEKKKPIISSNAPPLPKRSISLPGAKDTKKNAGNVDLSPQAPAPPRPPLPKGILRTVVDGDVVSNSKMRKEAANKRFSMFEMGTGPNATSANKRCSLQEPYYLPGHSEKKGCAHTKNDAACVEDDEGLAGVGSEHHHHLCSHAEFEDVLRLSDYIHMSTAAFSDVSIESEWDDDKMARLRLQVSRFLSTASSEGSEHANHQTSKAVSFGTAEKLRPGFSGGDLKTPPNSPNVSALLGNHRQYQCKQPLSDLPIREEDPGETSADEHLTPSTSSNKTDLKSKRALVTAVSDAVEEIICHFSGASTPGECARLGDSAVTPAVANSVIGTLCPALYAVLSDGLLTNIATAFGDISNSVWQVVEASAQQGHMTRSLNELVLRLNSEDVFSEGLLKFNAFVFGLLNVRSVDAWMGYLRTRESILRKHYGPEALLVLSLRGGPTFRALTDSLLAALRPLSLLPFHLDLLFECRQLHQSLQRLGAAAATSPTSLLRLVRSIQNSVGQLTIAEEYSSTLKGDSSDNPLPDLLELSSNSTMLSAPTKRNSRSRQLRRPRSCIDPTGDLLDPSTNLRKRWSGVQLGSKLSQALDRLLAEDAEEDFSDSLNATPATPATPLFCNQTDQSTSEDATLVSHDSDMDHTDTDMSDRSGAVARARRANAMGVGGKFRRLQMKWEKLSGSGTESRDHSTRASPEASPTKTMRPRTSFSGSTRTSPAMSPVKSTSRSSLHSPGSTTSSTSSVSRIPRPVTSPVRPPTGIPLPRCATSPTQAQATMRKPNLPLAQGKRSSVVAARTSRVDQTHTTEHRSPAIRPSSLPYSPVASGQVDVGKKSSQRRANSASVSRPGSSARKPKAPPRYVRTIKHQLASDSGHLSFSTGERLSLVLEVDEQWLLCCRGDRKGLVRRSAVVATQDHSSRF